MLEAEHCFPESCHFFLDFFDFFDFCIPFYVGSTSGTDTGIHYNSGSAKAKSCGCASVSTALLTRGGYQWSH
jgi:hypothetical protein